MSTSTNRNSGLWAAARRAGFVYGLLACLSFAFAVQNGSSASDLRSGVIIFAIGGLIVGLTVWFWNENGQRRTKQGRPRR